MLKRAVLAGLAVAALFLIGTFVIGTFVVGSDRLTDPITYVIAAGLVLATAAIRYAWARKATRSSAA